MDIAFAELKNRKLRVQSVDVAEWFSPDAKMYVRELSAAEAMKAAQAEGDDLEQQLEWFAMCLCDKQGTPMVPDGESIDQSSMPAGLFRAIVEAAIELNGMGEDDAEKN